MNKFCITKEGVIEYYGNRVGYIKDNTAIVDKMFEKQDLIDMIKESEDVEISWKDDVYDNLVDGKSEDSVLLKKCKIYQLKPDVDVRIRFIGYDEMIDKGYGKPDISNYKVVFDGNVPTNNLDELYIKFNGDDIPDNFVGHKMSKSDIIELYDENECERFYVDKFGFVKLDEESPQMDMSQTQNEFEPIETLSDDIDVTEQETEQKQTEPIFEKVEEEPVQKGNDEEEFVEETFTFTM